jgi:hypothetical protein
VFPRKVLGRLWRLNQSRRKAAIVRRLEKAWRRWCCFRVHIASVQSMLSSTPILQQSIYVRTAEGSFDAELADTAKYIHGKIHSR